MSKLKQKKVKLPKNFGKMRGENQTLDTLIKKHKFDWVNPDITNSNFPDSERRWDDYKLFHFDRYISTEDVVFKMKNEGYVPANIHELLTWKGWGDKDFVVALGSFARVDGNRYVACLSRSDAERSLYLYWYVGGWDDDDRFLAVRNLALEPLDTQPPALGDLDALTLRIQALEDWKRRVQDQLI